MTTAAPIVVPPRSSERHMVADQVAGLAAEVGKLDPPVATVLYRLADAARNGRHEETRGFAGAVDPHSLAELLVGRRSEFWALLEVFRNVLIFAPIGVTWYGLATASEAYGRALTQDPALASKPFLLLWQQGFPGTINFSTLAFIDATLIGLLILLSFALHVRMDLRDVAKRTRLLLKESEIRSLLGHAMSLATTSGLSDTDSDALLADMVAEERRIYERAMEREQKLFDMENAIGELREAAGELARVAEAMSDRLDLRSPRGEPAPEGEGERRRFRRRG
jgi:hypothetical protein